MTNNDESARLRSRLGGQPRKQRFEVGDIAVVARNEPGGWFGRKIRIIRVEKDGLPYDYWAELVEPVGPNEYNDAWFDDDQLI